MQRRIKKESLKAALFPVYSYSMVANGLLLRS